MIGMLSVSSLIASIADKNDVESAGEQEASQMALASDDSSSTSSSSKAPTSADDFYPVIRERWSGPNMTAITSESETLSLADFDIRFPTQMPSGYKLQLGIVNSETGEDNKYVLLYYSANPITEDTRFNHFWEQGGISIIYHKNVTEYFADNGDHHMSYSSIHNMADFARSNGKSAYEPVINGHRGVAIGDHHHVFQGFPIHDPAQVDFGAGNTYISIQAYMDTEELVRIAESIPM